MCKARICPHNIWVAHEQPKSYNSVNWRFFLRQARFADAYGAWLCTSESPLTGTAAWHRVQRAPGMEVNLVCFSTARTKWKAEIHVAGRTKMIPYKV
ncbi:hypothetical protein AALO_G00091760 [Alosa alosa]|uniref:Uncharacterized protein n=1 Tax=Alosa alosa TaxID=278164 RepID=A0AAV6GWA5_9TELE|nr:hypothetical protein AALO_G00091760 [Alosa alosa]